MNTPPDILCSACLTEFSIFLSYIRGLHFGDKPNYGYIHKLFHELFVCEGYHFNHPFAECTMDRRTDDKNAVVRAGTRNGQGHTQHTGGRMYVPCSSMQCLLIAACLACVIIVVAITLY